MAYIVSEEAGILNLDLTMGCLLHDTVEDTEIVLEDIKHEFGDYVYNLIQEVTDNKQLPRQKRKELQVRIKLNRVRYLTIGTLMLKHHNFRLNICMA